MVKARAFCGTWWPAGTVYQSYILNCNIFDKLYVGQTGEVKNEVLGTPRVYKVVQNRIIPYTY
jgi:hypothetical protein